MSVPLIVVADYWGHRIEINAVVVDGRWNAEVRIRRTLTQEKLQVETVTCLKLTADPCGVERRDTGIVARTAARRVGADGSSPPSLLLRADQVIE